MEQCGRVSAASRARRSNPSLERISNQELRIEMGSTRPVENRWPLESPLTPFFCMESRPLGSRKKLVSGTPGHKMNRNQKIIEEKEGRVVASLPSPLL